MSSRALRKLGKQTDLISMSRDKGNGEEEDDTMSDSEEDEIGPKSIPRKEIIAKQNKFQLLTADDDEDDKELSNSGSNNEKENDDQKHFSSNIGKQESTVKLGNAAVKHKKKKRRKKQGKPIQQIDYNNSKVEGHFEDEIEKSIREVNQLLGETNITNVGQSDSSSLDFSCKSLLGIESRNLNPDTEMKRRFGANVIASERRFFAQEKPARKNTNKVILALLNKHPNHIDSLLQLSEICKINEDQQMATELIERALYIHERSFHTLFSITKSNCRLDYRRVENRSFFLALFRHMTYLGDRACYRTALEFCKLILGLDAEDQLAMLLLIDFYAIKSEEYDFLLGLYEEWKTTKNLLQLPNFAYSIPLAMFYSKKYSIEQASSMLQDAMIKFPTVLLPTMDKCSVTLGNDIMKHPYFQRTNDVKQCDGLNRLASLYVGRCHGLWKIPEVLDWLENCAKSAIERIDNNDPLCLKWSQLWKTLYQRMPLNIYRHIIVSDIKEAARSLPPEISNRAVLAYDPLPPEDSVCGYTIPERRRQQASDGGVLSLFLRSFLPSYGMNEQPNRPNVARREPRQEAQGAEAIDRLQLGNDVAQGAQRLMGAMRELLNSMTYRGDLDEARNEDEEQQDWDDGLE
eukprot:gene18729-20618_t